MDALALEAAEEVFGHGVVIGIALAGHALPDAETDVYKRQALRTAVYGAGRKKQRRGQLG